MQLVLLAHGRTALVAAGECREVSWQGWPRVLLWSTVELWEVKVICVVIYMSCLGSDQRTPHHPGSGLSSAWNIIASGSSLRLRQRRGLWRLDSTPPSCELSGKRKEESAFARVPANLEGRRPARAFSPWRAVTLYPRPCGERVLPVQESAPPHSHSRNCIPPSIQMVSTIWIKESFGAGRICLYFHDL